MVMWRLTWRGLLSHWVRFVMTATAIVLGISFLTGSFVITDTIRAAFDDLFAQTTRGTDAVVRYKAQFSTDFGDARTPVAASLVPTVARVDGVSVVEGSIQVENVQILNRKGTTLGGFAPQFGFSWPAHPELAPWRIAQGRGPRTDTEVVIDRASARKARYRLGDKVPILAGQFGRRDFTLVGITRFGRVDRPLGATSALFTPSFAQRLAGTPGKFDSISVGARPGVSQAVLAARLRAAIRVPGVEVLTGEQLRKEQQSNARKELKFLDIALGLFAAIGLLVGGFIIFNTFTIIVAQRTRELALLRATGASPGQVARSVLGESTLVGVIASAMGVVGGVGLAAGLRRGLAALGTALPGGAVVVQPRTVLLGFGVGIAVTVLAALFPARRAGRVPPIAALRSVALESKVALAARIMVGVALVIVGVVALLLGLFVITDGTKQIWGVGAGAVALFGGIVWAGPALVRPVAALVGKPVSALRGTPGRLARDNSVRNPRRTSRTAIALTLGVALVGFITIFGASTKKSVRKIFGGQLTADYVITSGSGFNATPFSDGVTRSVGALPVVDAVTGLRFWDVQLRQANGAFDRDGVVALQPGKLEQFLDAGKVEGDLNGIERGIAISRAHAAKLGVGLGGTVTLRFGTEQVATRFTVVAVYEKTDLIGDMLISLRAFEQHVPIKVDFLAAVIVKPGVTTAQMETAFAPIKHDYPVLKLQSRKDYIDSQAAQVDQVVAFIYVLLALSVLIALLGIANTLALSVFERTSEIGLLRAVCMSRAQVRTSVRWEAVIVAVLGTVVGLVLGLFFGWAVFRSLRDQGFTEFDFAPFQLVVVVVVGAVASIGAALVPAWRASRLNVLDAINADGATSSTVDRAPSDVMVRRSIARLVDLVPILIVTMPFDNVVVIVAAYTVASAVVGAIEGATGAFVGKWITRLRVVGPNGDRIGAGRGAVRGALQTVDSIFAFGYLYAALTDEHRRLGDHAAKSYVVDTSFRHRRVAGALAIDLDAPPVERPRASQPA